MSWKGVYQSKNISSLFLSPVRKLGPTRIKELLCGQTVVDFGTRTQNLAPGHRALNFQSSVLPSSPIALPFVTQLSLELCG